MRSLASGDSAVLACVFASGLAVLIGGCDDPVPLGPDLVDCECECDTTTAMLPPINPPACGYGTCDPPCSGGTVCGNVNGCYSTCNPTTPQAEFINSHDVTTLHVCVDSSNPSNAVKACSQRCDKFASPSLLDCVNGVLGFFPLTVIDGDYIHQLPLPPELSQIPPSEQQNIADFIVQECGGLFLDSETGTCGLSTVGPSALSDLLLCILSPYLTFGNSPPQFPQHIRTCHLVTDPPTDPLAPLYVVQQKNGCPEFASPPPSGQTGTPVGGTPMPASSTVLSGESLVEVAGADVSTASTHPFGSASTGRIGNVLVIGQLTGSLPDGHLSVKGHDVMLSGGFLTLEAPVSAVLTDDPVFVIPPGRAKFIVTGSVSGQITSIESVNVTNISGFYDEAAGQFGLAGSLAIQGLNAVVAVDLTFNFTNRPPRTNAGPDQTVECTLPTREGVVHLSAGDSADPDSGDSIASYVWTVGRQLVAQGPNAGDATANVGLGTRIATLVTKDTKGSTSTDTALVTVVDTKPPIFDSVTVTPDCLWPPDHEMVLLRLGQEIQVQSHDACDPTAPRVVIKSVKSNQPALDVGSGNAAPDIVNGSGAVCLRAERGAVVRTPRVYTITLAATDGAGNESEKTVQVIVPHDQGGGGKCPAVSPSLMVDDGDPRCLTDVPAPVAPAGQQKVSSAVDSSNKTGGNGCNMTQRSGRFEFVLLALCLMILHRRRRSSRVD